MGLISIMNGQSSSPYLDRSAFPCSEGLDCLCPLLTWGRVKREDRSRKRLINRANVDTTAGTAELMVELRAGLDAAAAQIGAEKLLLSVRLFLSSFVARSDSVNPIRQT